MSSKFNRHTRFYATIFLSAYLFLVTLTIFHYHHFDYQTNLFKIENRTDRGNEDIFGKLVDSTNECIVFQFTGTVLNYSYFGTLVSARFFSPQIIKLKEIYKLPSKPKFNDNQLRAPPALVLS